MKTVTVTMDKLMLELLDKLTEYEIYPNRSECIRSAIRNLLLYHRKLEVHLEKKFTSKMSKKLRSEVFHLNNNNIEIEDYFI